MPPTWTPEQHEQAKSILASGQGSPDQLRDLQAAIGEFEASRGGGSVQNSDPGVQAFADGATSAPEVDQLEASREALRQVRTGGQSAELLAPREQTSTFDAGALNAFQGMTFGHGDELAAKLASTLGLLKAGSSYGEQEFLGDLRQQIANSQADHPVVSGVSRFGGEMLPSLLAGGAMGRAASLGGAMRQGAALGAGAEALSAHGNADDGDRGQAALDAIGPGIVGGAVGGAIGRGVEKAIPAAAEGMRNFARRQRAASTGLTPSDAKNMVRQQGRGALEKFGQSIEDEGLHKNGAPVPTGLGTYAQNSIDATEKLGPEIGAFSDEMVEKGVRVDTGQVAQEMADAAGKLERLLAGASDAGPDAADLNRRAIELAREGRPTYDRVFETRKWLDDQAYHFENEKNTKAADLYRMIAGKLRAAMFDAVGDSPDDLARLQQLNKSFETASRTKNYSVGAEAAHAVGGEQLASRALRMATMGLSSPRGRAAQSAGARGIADASEWTLDKSISPVGGAAVTGSDIARKIAELRQEQELERVRQSLPQ